MCFVMLWLNLLIFLPVCFVIYFVILLAISFVYKTNHQSGWSRKGQKYIKNGWKKDSISDFSWRSWRNGDCDCCWYSTQSPGWRKISINAWQNQCNLFKTSEYVLSYYAVLNSGLSEPWVLAGVPIVGTDDITHYICIWFFIFRHLNWHKGVFLCAMYLMLCAGLVQKAANSNLHLVEA